MATQQMTMTDEGESNYTTRLNTTGDSRTVLSIGYIVCSHFELLSTLNAQYAHDILTLCRSNFTATTDSVLPCNNTTRTHICHCPHTSHTGHRLPSYHRLAVQLMLPYQLYST